MKSLKKPNNTSSLLQSSGRSPSRLSISTPNQVSIRIWYLCIMRQLGAAITLGHELHPLMPEARHSFELQHYFLRPASKNAGVGKCHCQGSYASHITNSVQGCRALAVSTQSDSSTFSLPVTWKMWMCLPQAFDPQQPSTTVA